MRQEFSRGSLIYLSPAMFFMLLGCIGPQTYEDCVLEHVKEGMDAATRIVITQSCRAKFPVEETPRAPAAQLSRDELARLTGRAGIGSGNSYRGSIYNGNTGITLTEIRLQITTTVAGEQVSRTYRETVLIRPESAGNFSFDIIMGDPGADYAWIIVGAAGQRQFEPLPDLQFEAP